MSKGGYSKKGLFGNVTHYDSKGKKIGESRPGIFGGMNNYDANGKLTGHSERGFLGGVNHYDTHGNKIGHSDSGFLGGVNHYDANGHKIAHSDSGVFGTYHHSGGPVTSGVGDDPYRKAAEAAAWAAFQEEQESLEEENSWREECDFKDYLNYDIDPEDYDTQEEYEEALQEKKYAWREDCDYNDYLNYDIDPEDYDTQEEYEEALQGKKYVWREDCDYDDYLNYDVDPEDYETEAEYLEALQEARYGWREEYDDGEYVWYDTKPEDYETEEEYLEALKEESAQEYVVEDSEEWDDSETENEETEDGDSLETENEEMNDEEAEIEEDDIPLHQRLPKKLRRYCIDDEILYCKAIREHFELPITLPPENKGPELLLYQALVKIARKDILLTFQVWKWCIGTFAPYVKKEEYENSKMTDHILNQLRDFPEDFPKELVHFFEENLEFEEKVIQRINHIEFYSYEFATLVGIAIRENMPDTAKKIFQDGLIAADGAWKGINAITKDTLRVCCNYEETESVGYFEQELLPLIKAYRDGMIRDEVEVWEADIRKYEKEVYRQKYAWKEYYRGRELYGLNLDDYEDEDAFSKVYFDKRRERQAENQMLAEERHLQRILELRKQLPKSRGGLGLGAGSDGANGADEITAAFESDEASGSCTISGKRNVKETSAVSGKKGNTASTDTDAAEEDWADEKVYIYCGVVFSKPGKVYCYRTEDETIQIGDKVIVAVGREMEEKEVEVVHVGRYLRACAPYPVDKSKCILRKCE